MSSNQILFTGYCFEMPDAKSGLDHASTYVPSWYSLNKKMFPVMQISVIEHNTISIFLWNQIHKCYSRAGSIMEEYQL